MYIGQDIRGTAANRICSRGTHFIGDVLGSDSVSGLGCADGVSIFIALRALLRFLFYSFKAPPDSFVQFVICSRIGESLQGDAVDRPRSSAEWACMKSRAYRASEDRQHLTPCHGPSTPAKIADRASSQAGRRRHACGISNNGTVNCTGTSA